MRGRFLSNVHASRQCGGERGGIVANVNGRRCAALLQRRRQRLAEIQSFRLLQIRRLFNQTLTIDSGKADADSFNLMAFTDELNFTRDLLHDLFGGHPAQDVGIPAVLRENMNRADELIIFHKADGDMLRHQCADFFPIRTSRRSQELEV